MLTPTPRLVALPLSTPHNHIRISPPALFHIEQLEKLSKGVPN